MEGARLGLFHDLLLMAKVFSTLGYAVTPQVKERIGFETSCGLADGSLPEPAGSLGDTEPRGEDEECDVVIVGSGAGGAVAAATLAEAGLDVVLLEAGDHYNRDSYPSEPLDAIASALPRRRADDRRGPAADSPSRLARVVGGGSAAGPRRSSGRRRGRGGDRLERVARVAVAVVVAAGLEHERRRARPRPGSPRRPRRRRRSRRSPRRIPRPRPRGSVSPERAGRLGQRAVGEAAADLEADPLLDLGRRPRSRGWRRPSPSAAGRGGGRSASPPCLRRKSSRAPASRRLKRQGNGSHSKARSPSRSRRRTRGETEARNSATGPETSTSRSAAGRPSMPGAIAAQIALRVRCSAAESPGERLQPGVGGPADPAGQRPEPEREQREEAVDEEVEQVDEDVLVEEEEAERGERGGGLAGREHQQQRRGSGRRRSGRPGRCR